MPTPTPPVARALGALGARLRAVREAAGLTGGELAAALGVGWKQPKVSKIETGRQLPTSEEIAAWAAATGVDPGPLLALRDKAAAAYGAYKDRLAGAGGPLALQDELTALAQSCTFLAEYQPALVPGRLQTPDYMREKALGNEFLTDNGIPPDKLGHVIAAKIRRQAILYEPGREFVHIVGEATLRTRIGQMTTVTLRRQLAHLAEMAILPGHTFGVVPFTVNSPVIPASGWALFDRDLVRIETIGGVLQLTEPDVVARYSRWLDQLLEVALIGADAAEFCQQIAAELPEA
ncbi:MAG: helix-turn-helix domain-containing protein [Pseudonocardia sp.]